MAIHGLGFELFLGLAALAGAALSAAPAARAAGPARGAPAGRPARAARARHRRPLARARCRDRPVRGSASTARSRSSRRRSAGIRGRTFWLALLGLGLAPGIAEELLCRGLVQRGLRAEPGRARGGGCSPRSSSERCTSIPCTRPSPPLLGLYLGILCHLAGSVRAAIACHAANNLCAVLTVGLRRRASRFRRRPRSGSAAASRWRPWRGCGGALGAPPPLYDSRRDGSAGPTQLGPTDGGRIGRL